MDRLKASETSSDDAGARLARKNRRELESGVASAGDIQKRRADLKRRAPLARAYFNFSYHNKRRRSPVVVLRDGPCVTPQRLELAREVPRYRCGFFLPKSGFLVSLSATIGYPIWVPIRPGERWACTGLA
jgi:hypothetical protein